MAENCPDNKNISMADPASQAANTGAVQVNLSQSALDIFNPNYALSAIQTFNVFNNVANKMFGIDARWFRAVPQQRSKDVIFQEYTLSSVEDAPLCLKVVVPDGNFPDSKYQYDLMGLEYQVPLEVQIDKKYWEEIAGFGTAPQKKDIVYLPMPHKLYQVESSYLKRGFMEQETTWVVNLRKYMPEASRKEGSEVKETIDMYTVSEQEIFGEALGNEMAKLTDDKQMSQFNSTERDKYKILDGDLKIITSNVEFYGTIVAQSFYDLNTSKMYDAVEYKNPTGDEITETFDRAICEWVMPRPVTEEYDVVWIQKDVTITYPANYKIKVKGTKRFNLNDTFVISRPGALNFYAKVIDESNSVNGIYFCEIDSAVETHLLSISSSWASYKGYKMKVKDPIVLLDGRSSSGSGFKAAIYANQYFKVNYGTQEYILVMDDLLDDNKWYGVVVNIGNTWKQYNVYIWEQHPTDESAKLRIKYYETLRFVPEYVSITKYVVDKSPTYATNIRLFKTTIEEEKQNLELLSFFTRDSDQSLILDNCDQDLRKLPYISKQK
jgi:hypothetical protein